MFLGVRNRSWEVDLLRIALAPDAGFVVVVREYSVRAISNGGETTEARNYSELMARRRDSRASFAGLQMAAEGRP